MMLATNKKICSKEDVLKVVKLYFFRWCDEEYFRCKKQVFHFEGFRVRKLKTINALNFYITLCMAFLAHLSMKPETNALKVSIINSHKGECTFLLLSAGKRRHRHTVVCKRGRQALVPDQAAKGFIPFLPSTLP